MRPINAAGASGSAASAAAHESTNKVITANEPSVLQTYEPVPTGSFARFSVTSPKTFSMRRLDNIGPAMIETKRDQGIANILVQNGITVRPLEHYLRRMQRRVILPRSPGKCNVCCLQLAFLYSKSSCSVRRWLFSIAVAKPSSFASFSHVLAALRYAFLACGNSGACARV